jgi:hypothetical protein
MLAQVTNPNTGEFLQPEQLKAAGLLSPDYSNSKKYPIKTVYQIARFKNADGNAFSDRLPLFILLLNAIPLRIFYHRVFDFMVIRKLLPSPRRYPLHCLSVIRSDFVILKKEVFQTC